MQRKVILISALVLLPVFITGCSLKPASNNTAQQTGQTPVATGQAGTPNPQSGTTYLNVDPRSADAVLNENFQQAETKSKLWQKNARFTHFSAKFPVDFQLGTITETYTYGADEEAYNWWTLTISGKTGKSVRAIIPKEDFLGTSYPAIPTQFWKTNYIDALQLAEVNGGSQYRAVNAGTEVTASLAVGQPKNYLWWTVEYSAPAGEALSILVNPATKEVFDANGQPIGIGSHPSPTP